MELSYYIVVHPQPITTNMTSPMTITKFQAICRGWIERNKKVEEEVEEPICCVCCGKDGVYPEDFCGDTMCPDCWTEEFPYCYENATKDNWLTIVCGCDQPCEKPRFEEDEEEDEDVCCVACAERVCGFSEEPPHKDRKGEAICDECWSSFCEEEEYHICGETGGRHNAEMGCYEKVLADDTCKIGNTSYCVACFEKYEEELEAESDEEEEEYKSCPLCGILPQTCDCDKCGIHGCFECITICKEVELCSTCEED